jgi:cyclic pyranopterin phosphate synthase
MFIRQQLNLWKTTMDKYRIDSHKLMYHIGRVSDWMKGETIYPIYIEASPSGACNHRCIYCGLDFMGYRPAFYDTAKYSKVLGELGKLGVKSIMYAGEGEPFLHKEFPLILENTRAAGIDAAITTNAVLFNPQDAERVLSSTQWIKVSINAGTARTYAAIHQTRETDFEKVIENMRHAVSVKVKNNYQCALGMQMLLLPENQEEAVTLAAIARDIGMEYLVIKPYSQHPKSVTTKYNSISYRDSYELADELKKFNTDEFNVVFRLNTMKKWDENDKPYERCNALPFWSYIDSEGNVWGCSMYLKDTRFLYGNIFGESFEDIWNSEKRKKSLNFTNNELDPCNCRVNCRMDEINRYLWELKNPSGHVNFI